MLQIWRIWRMKVFELASLTNQSIKTRLRAEVKEKPDLEVRRLEVVVDFMRTHR